MAKKKASNSVARVRASITRARREGTHVVERLRKEAAKLVARSRAEVMKDMRALGSEIRDRADRGVRDLERKVMHQFHAATQEQVKRLERRVLRLEARVSELNAKLSGPSGEKAA